MTGEDILLSGQDIPEACVASLYIKDPETAALAERVSRRLGTSKTDAVRRALAALERTIPVRPSTAADCKL